MSRLVLEHEKRTPWQLGDLVEFDGPYGDRLRGRIARIYFGDPAAFQVEVDGDRYEAHIHFDNMVMV